MIPHMKLKLARRPKKLCAKSATASRKRRRLIACSGRLEGLQIRSASATKQDYRIQARIAHNIDVPYKKIIFQEALVIITTSNFSNTNISNACFHVVNCLRILAHFMHIVHPLCTTCMKCVKIWTQFTTWQHALLMLVLLRSILE